MSAFTFQITYSLHNKLKELSAREGISINQFIATAVAEKMAAMMTEE
jgi:predicted HicB family RNase H-like nuclease